MNNKSGLKNPFLCILLTVCLIPYATSLVVANPLITSQTTLIKGLFIQDNFGYAVSGAVDVNGDGYDDVIASAYTTNATNSLNGSATGTVYVLFGSKNGIKNIDLTNLTSAQGFKIIGVNGSNIIGNSVSGGDVNGDGIDDIIIGSQNTLTGMSTYAVNAYVIFGKRHGLSDIDLSELSLDQGIQITGPNGDSYASFIVSAADVNGDGIKDILLGASYVSYLNRSNNGIAYILYGTYKGFANIDLNNLNPKQGARIIGSHEKEGFASSISGAGDVNGDGVDDIIIGAYGANVLDRTMAGVSYVIFGSRQGFNDLDLNNFTPYQGFKLFGANSFDIFGSSVSGAGDVNKDGIGDIIIGAPTVIYDKKGAAYIIFGKPTGFSDIDVKYLSNSQGIRIEGANIKDLFGISVGNAGDVNNDGVDDVVIGTYSPRHSLGAAYVIFGDRNGLSDMEVENLGNNEGFKILGDDANETLGFSVSGAGDVNGDGFDDLIIGAPGGDPERETAIGQVYIVTI